VQHLPKRRFLPTDPPPLPPPRRFAEGGEKINPYGEERQHHRRRYFKKSNHRCLVLWFGMPSIGHSSTPTVVRVNDSTISRVPSGSAIHLE